MRWETWITSGMLLLVSAWPADAQSRHHHHGYNSGYSQHQYHRQYGQFGLGFNSYSYSSGYVAAPLVPNSYAPVYYGANAWPAYNGYSAPGPVIVPPAVGLGFYSPGISGYFGITGNPGFYVPYPDYDLANNPQAMAAPLQDAWRENQERWGENLPPLKPDPVSRPVAPSSTTARLRSLEAQQRGDAHMRDQQWMLAYQDYKKATDYAEDQAAAQWRLGLVLLKLQHYDSASIALKRAVYLDPQWPQTAPPLTDVFGENSTAARTVLAHNLAEYVRQDIRDPERLFLLGAMLHFEHDPRAQEVLETGVRLAGRGAHFDAFLRSPAAPVPAAATTPPAVMAPQNGLPTLPSPAVDAPLPLPPAPVPEVIPTPQSNAVAPAIFEGPRLNPPGL
ncbi:hypothetical protein GC163_03855 [bacterium]|nr:hypothetical protein [bacterium]